MFKFVDLDLSFGLPTAVQRGLSQVPRWRATVDATLELTHERVDDVPLLLGFLSKLRLPEILDRHLPPHPLHQGLSNGWLISVWIVYILSQADHRKSHVQAWVEDLGRTFESLLGQTIRPVEFNDDRLTLVLRRLSDLEAWQGLEADLWSTHCDVYALPVERVRLDATTSYGYHTTDDDGLMQLGHSKDHRPDLPQFKLMAAAAEPTGLLLAADVHPGNAADDPLYLPLYRRVRTLLGQTGLLYTGDCKMAALETRAEIAATGDYYLTRLPLTGTVPAQFAGWVEAAITGAQATQLTDFQRDEELIGKGYEFTRLQTALVESLAKEHTWTERVQILRSESLAQSQATALERRLAKAEAAIRGLTPPPGPGRTPFTTASGLDQAIATIVAEHDVEGLLEVSHECQETTRTHYVGRGRGGPNRPRTTEHSVRYQITTIVRNTTAIADQMARQGWQAQVTNAPEIRLGLADSLEAYRGGCCVERGFHLLKDQPLGIRPLYVRRDDQIQGLTHLVTLALRILLLFEVLVRRGQEQDGEELKDLYPGQAKRTTARPTAKRVLEAISRAKISVIRVESEHGCRWHLTALPVLVRKVLRYLGLSEVVYTRLVINSS
jgi:transposase